MKQINLIAAIGKKMELGFQNQLLCHLPADLKHFKSLTIGHTVVMGRKTWDSLPIKPLPNRRNLVLTSNRNLHFEGAEPIYSPEELLAQINDQEEVFIIGGASVYKTFINIAQKLYITRIEGTFEADVYFPKIDTSRWQLVEETYISNDDKNPYSMIFQTYLAIPEAKPAHPRNN